ncbi:hypothetical protein ACHAWF_004391 [Thalassiosira exigua]
MEMEDDEGQRRNEEASASSSASESEPQEESDGASLGSVDTRSYPENDMADDDEVSDDEGGSKADDITETSDAGRTSELDGDEEMGDGDGGDHAEEPAESNHESEGEGDEEGEDSSFPPSHIKLGGPGCSAGKPAYALLAGVFQSAMTPISIPIARLPAHLGKEHPTKDPSFVGLPDDAPEGSGGGSSSLTQSMCCIFYTDARGGRLGQYKKGRKREGGEGDGGEGADPLDGMIYKPYENQHAPNEEADKDMSALPVWHDVIRPPGMDARAPLPSSGFFAVECTCRQIMVGRRVIKKGQTAMLTDGMPIRLSSYCLYFMLPSPSSEAPPAPPASIKVKLASTPVRVNVELAASTVSSGSAKKDQDSAGSDSDRGSEEDLAFSPPVKKPRKSDDFTSALDDKTDRELLDILALKVSEGAPWDFEGQRLGSTLAARACRAAALSVAIQRVVRKEGGATQRDILDWVTLSPESVFREYEELMLKKIEKKSFMMSIGKAILRAGWTKNEFLSGRAFRYNLPPDVPLTDLLKHPAPDQVDIEHGRPNVVSSCPNNN